MPDHDAEGQRCESISYVGKNCFQTLALDFYTNFGQVL